MVEAPQKIKQLQDWFMVLSLKEFARSASKLRKKLFNLCGTLQDLCLKSSLLEVHKKSRTA